MAGNWKQVHRFQGGRHMTSGRGKLQGELRCFRRGRRTLNSLQGSQNLLAPHQGQKCEKKFLLIKVAPSMCLWMAEIEELRTAIGGINPSSSALVILMSLRRWMLQLSEILKGFPWKGVLAECPMSPPVLRGGVRRMCTPLGDSTQ